MLREDGREIRRLLSAQARSIWPWDPTPGLPDQGWADLLLGILLPAATRLQLMRCNPEKIFNPSVQANIYRKNHPHPED